MISERGVEAAALVLEEKTRGLITVTHSMAVRLVRRIIKVYLDHADD